jgi:hypothetical protein
VPAPEPGVDLELDQVTAWFVARDDMTEQFGLAIRNALDELIDTARTRRVSFEECDQLEQRYMGFKLEHVIRGQFELEHGKRMDYSVDGIDVDCKWSKNFKEWTIPREAVGHICLVVWGNDDTRGFAVGLIRIREDILVGGNQDKKRTIQSPGGISEIRWLVPTTKSLPENFLLHLPEADRRAILGHRGGDERLMELFKRCEGIILTRHTIHSVGQQVDAARRARAARPRLNALGLELLNGHWKKHKALAKKLGGPVPKTAEEWVVLRSDGSTPRRMAERLKSQVESPKGT